MAKTFTKEIFDAICNELAISSLSIGELCENHQVSKRTFYSWLEKNKEYKNNVYVKLSKSRNYEVLSNRVKGDRAESINDYRRSNARKTNKSRFGSTSYVYLIQIEKTSLYKIGVSSNPLRRLRDIESTLPYKIVKHCITKIDNAYDIEAYLHGLFITFHVKGEWFKLNNNSFKYVLNYISSNGKTDKIYTRTR